MSEQEFEADAIDTEVEATTDDEATPETAEETPEEDVAGEAVLGEDVAEEADEDVADVADVAEENDPLERSAASCGPSPATGTSSTPTPAWRTG